MLQKLGEITFSDLLGESESTVRADLGLDVVGLSSTSWAGDMDSTVSLTKTLGSFSFNLVQSGTLDLLKNLIFFCFQTSTRASISTLIIDWAPGGF